MNQLLNQALQLHKQGKLDDAGKIYQQILTTDPNCADAWNLLACINVTRKNLSAAFEQYEKALKLAPNKSIKTFSYSKM